MLKLWDVYWFIRSPSYSISTQVRHHSHINKGSLCFGASRELTELEKEGRATGCDKSLRGSAEGIYLAMVTARLVTKRNEDDCIGRDWLVCKQWGQSLGGASETEKNRVWHICRLSGNVVVADPRWGNYTLRLVNCLWVVRIELWSTRNQLERVSLEDKANLLFVKSRCWRRPIKWIFPRQP